MGRPKLFRSYWQGGFECSTHILRTGKRLDLVASTGHDIYVDRDYARLKQTGMLTVREGLRWHLIEQEEGCYDFSSVIATIEAAQRHGIQIIWDLMHFGWPSRLDIFSEGFPGALANFASAFGRLLRAKTNETPFISPINEISFFSWAGGDVGYLNPFARDRGPELKRQLVKACLKASDAVRAELPDVRLVAPEPVIHIAGNPEIPGDVVQAREYTSSMFEAWDMISGRSHNDLGGNESYLDIVGVNYYDRNQWWNHGGVISRHEPGYRPFGEILSEVYGRYRRPLFISETGCEDLERPSWLAYIAGEARAAIRRGVPVEGLCLYPILNHPGWDDDRHCFNGLWDYAQPNGDREIYQPLVDEVRRQQASGRQIYEPLNLPLRAARCDLPLSPAMEFCIPAAAAPDEPFRPEPPRFLR